MKKQGDGKKTEQLHIVLSKEEKALFLQMAEREAEHRGQRYTVTRLIKDRVLSSERENRDRLRLKQMVWLLQKRETELLQIQEQITHGYEVDQELKKVQEAILKNTSEILSVLQEGGG